MSDFEREISRIKEQLTLFQDAYRNLVERAEAWKRIALHKDTIEDRQRVGYEPPERLVWLIRCEKAIQSMADQICSPKTTAEEMVASILGEPLPKGRACR